MQLLWGLKDSNLAIVMTSILTDVSLCFFFYLMQSCLIEPKKDDYPYYPAKTPFACMKTVSCQTIEKTNRLGLKKIWSVQVLFQRNNQS